MRGWPSRALVSVGAALSFLLASLPLLAQNAATGEYRAKANYLANFPIFVEWPQEAWSQGKTSFLVCVFGEFSFGTSLAEITRGRDGPRSAYCNPLDTQTAGIVRVSDSVRQPLGAEEIRPAVRGQTVLTVGETPGFLDAGGILSFSGQQGTIQFDVNLEAANKAHLKISSRLLALARHALNQTEAAKS
jgi:hypothetical protein